MINRNWIRQQYHLDKDKLKHHVYEYLNMYGISAALADEDIMNLEYTRQIVYEYRKLMHSTSDKKFIANNKSFTPWRPNK